MPDFYVDTITVDAYEYVTSCTKSEIEELISELVDGDYLPSSVLKLNKEGKVDDGLGRLQSDFVEKLDKLSKVYYSLSKEDEEFLQTIFNKYI